MQADMNQHSQSEREAMAKFIKWFPRWACLLLPPLFEGLHLMFRHLEKPSWLMASLFGYWTFFVGATLGWVGLYLFLRLRKTRVSGYKYLAVVGFIVAMLLQIILEEVIGSRWFDGAESLTTVGFVCSIVWSYHALKIRMELGLVAPSNSAKGAQQE